MSTSTADATDLRTLARAVSTRRRREDYRRLYRALRAAGITPTRPLFDAWQTGRERCWERWRSQQPDPRASRLDRLAAKYRSVLWDHGAPTGIYTTGGLKHVQQTDCDAQSGMRVLHAEGWVRARGRVPIRRQSLSYLCGRDEDGGRWVVRVPGRITTVADALAWTTPPAVKQALAEGRKVVQLGGLYAVESKTGYDAGRARIPLHYMWDARRRVLCRLGHSREVVLPWPVEFHRERALPMRTRSR